MLAVSFCLVCGCFSWRVRPAVSLPAYPSPPHPHPPPQPVALLSGVGFKGKETPHWLYTTTQFESALISQTWKIDTATLQAGLFLSVAVGNAGKQSPRAPPTGRYLLLNPVCWLRVMLRPALLLKEAYIYKFSLYLHC